MTGHQKSMDLIFICTTNILNWLTYIIYCRQNKDSRGFPVIGP